MAGKSEYKQIWIKNENPLNIFQNGAKKPIFYLGSLCICSPQVITFDIILACTVWVSEMLVGSFGMFAFFEDPLVKLWREMRFFWKLFGSRTSSVDLYRLKLDMMESGDSLLRSSMLGNFCSIVGRDLKGFSVIFLILVSFFLVVGGRFASGGFGSICWDFTCCISLMAGTTAGRALIADFICVVSFGKLPFCFKLDLYTVKSVFEFCLPISFSFMMDFSPFWYWLYKLAEVVEEIVEELTFISVPLIYFCVPWSVRYLEVWSGKFSEASGKEKRTRRQLFSACEEWRLTVLIFD